MNVELLTANPAFLSGADMRCCWCVFDLLKHISLLSASISYSSVWEHSKSTSDNESTPAVDLEDLINSTPGAGLRAHIERLLKIYLKIIFENLIISTPGAGIRAHIEWTEQPERRHGGEQLQEDPHHSHSGLCWFIMIILGLMVVVRVRVVMVANGFGNHDGQHVCIIFQS